MRAIGQKPEDLIDPKDREEYVVWLANNPD